MNNVVDNDVKAAFMIGYSVGPMTSGTMIDQERKTDDAS